MNKRQQEANPRDLRTFRYYWATPEHVPGSKSYGFVLDFRTDAQANAALVSMNEHPTSKGEVWTMQEADPGDFDHINNRARFERKMKRMGARQKV